MYCGFNLILDCDDVWKLFDEQSQCALLTFKLQEILKDYSENENCEIKKSLSQHQLLDGEKLKQEWFPHIGNKHIFISHSHQDVEIAKKLSFWLKQGLGLDCFIDSEVWKYADDLIEDLKNNSMEERKAASHVYMMLAASLNEVIDKSECVLFLNTKNSISPILKGKSRTLSPWIFSELTTTALIRKKQNQDRYTVPQKTNESLEQKAMNISHKAPLAHLTNLSVSGLQSWKAACDLNGKRRKYDALDILYEEFA